jgi:hypothetical protein
MCQALFVFANTFGECKNATACVHGDPPRVVFREQLGCRFGNETRRLRFTFRFTVAFA